MESTLAPVLGWILAALVWCAAPVVALAVSLAYFRRSKADPSIWRRLATSSHGFAIAFIYVVAISLGMMSAYDATYRDPFVFALIVPMALIALSLAFYRGSKQTHWLQIPNVLSLGWTGFMGVMAVTGNWL